jgi:sugar/nucleoside kinase (ribokinase family)
VKPAVPPVVVFGDACLHVTVRPGDAAEFSAGEVVLGPGGSAAMVAWQIAALERPVTMFGVAGNDELAGQVRGQLAAAGVDCSRWAAVPGATARVAILVGPDGGHRVVVDQGGVTEPDLALAEAAEQAELREDTLCYVPGFPGYDGVRTALTGRGARVVCDFGFRPWLTGPAAARRNILPRVSGVAVAVCSGASFPEAANQALARECLASGAGAVLTSLGPDGCLLTEAGGEVRVPGFAARALNTLGAGDSLVAGLLVAMAGGHALPRACVYAQAVAATKITTVAQPADAGRVLALLETAGWFR